MTIDGKNKAILDCNNVNGALVISSDNVVIKNLKIINSNGSGITIRSNNVLIDNCSFINGSAFYGGAILQDIYNFESYSGLTITNSIFNNFHASLRGGAIYMYGNDTKIIICNFMNNIAEDDGVQFT